MHELTLAQALVGEVVRIGAREKAEAVESVTVAIGALSGVDRAAFAFAFPLAAEGTVLAGASLNVVEVPLGVVCDDCGARSEPGLADLRCMACGSRRIRITEGRDLVIRSVDLRMA